MATRILRGLLILLGASAVAIGLSVFLSGATSTTHVAELAYSHLTGSTHAFTGDLGPTVESEMRFYAPLWIAYGVILIIAGRKLAAWLDRVPVLAAVFFAGGVGRALAYLEIGPPHPAFTVLMIVELTLPLVFIALWAALRRSVDPS